MFGPAGHWENLLGSSPPCQAFPLMFILTDKHKDPPFMPRLPSELRMPGPCAELLICAVGLVISKISKPSVLTIHRYKSAGWKEEVHKMIPTCSDPLHPLRGPQAESLATGHLIPNSEDGWPDNSLPKWGHF